MSLGSRGLMQFLGGNWKVQVQGVHLHSQFLHIYDSTTASTYSMRGERIPMDVQCKTSLGETRDHITINVYCYCSALSLSCTHTQIWTWFHLVEQLLFLTVKVFFQCGSKSGLECTNRYVCDDVFIGKQTLECDFQAFLLFTSSVVTSTKY